MIILGDGQSTAVLLWFIHSGPTVAKYDLSVLLTLDLSEIITPHPMGTGGG